MSTWDGSHEVTVEVTASRLLEVLGCFLELSEAFLVFIESLETTGNSAEVT